jgi:hypothetical protein
MTTLLKLFPTEKEMLEDYKRDCQRYKGNARLHWNDKSIETIAHEYVYRSAEQPEALSALMFDAVSIRGDIDIKELPQTLQQQIHNIGV